MNEYLGDITLDVKDTPFKDYTPSDWSVYFIEHYGQYDGYHHKQWVLDQVVRILKGTKVIIKLAKWSDGTEEYRVELDEPSQEYNDWVMKMRGEKDDDGNFDYDYDEGIAP